MKEERRVLSADEKAELGAKHNVCYICLDPLENYGPDEIEYDHIYNYADGYPQELSNFAPVHASARSNKANCHKSKGQKSPVEYREELRVLKALKKITGLKDPLPQSRSLSLFDCRTLRRNNHQWNNSSTIQPKNRRKRQLLFLSRG